MDKMISVLFLSLLTFTEISGHGRLLNPPGRSTAWRFGFNTPKNYNDHELNCGGAGNQWESQGGKCGLCGDPYQGPRENEYPGGKFATGTVVAQYTSGSTIDVTIQMTANHKGYHQFRLCKQDNPSSAITQSCLDENLLPDSTNGHTAHTMNPIANKDYTYSLELPAGLTCSHCVLQWKYNAGNRWGTDPVTGNSAVGLGPQEQFYGCADITITPAGASNTKTTTTTTVAPQQKSTATKMTSQRPSSTTVSQVATTTTTTMLPTTTTAQGIGSRKCVPTKTYQYQPGITAWCNTNCFHDPPYCPASHCICTNEDEVPGKEDTGVSHEDCLPTEIYKDAPGITEWCNMSCNRDPPYRYCPATHCVCVQTR